MTRTGVVTLLVLIIISLCGLVAAQQNVTATQALAADSSPSRAELTWEGWFVLVFILLMIIAMATEFMGSLAALFLISTIFRLAGIISSKELFSGFVNKGMLVIALMFVIVHPISHLPVARRVVAWLLKPPAVAPGEKRDPVWATLLPRAKLCFFAFILSPFIENVPHVAVITPVVSQVCREFGLAPSLILLPMAFAVCSANFLIIGSASNLIIASLQEEAGHEKLSFYELIKTNGPVALALQVYFIFLTPLLLRAKGAADQASSANGRAPAAVALQRSNADGGGKGVPSVSEMISEAAANGVIGPFDTVAMLRVPGRFDPLLAAADQEMQQEGDNEPVEAAPSSAPVLGSPHPCVGRRLAAALDDMPESIRDKLTVHGVLRPGDHYTVAEGAEPTTPSYAHPGDRGLSEHTFDPDFVLRAHDIIVLSGRPEQIRLVRHLAPFYYVAVTADHGLAKPTHPNIDDAAHFDDEELASEEHPERVSASALDANKSILPAGLTALPASRKQMPFAHVVVADEAHGVGQHLSSQSFVGHYHCSIVSLRAKRGGHLVGAAMSMHVLEPGDSMILRVQPDFLVGFGKGPSTEFYVVEPIGFKLNDVLRTKYVRVPECFASACGRRVETRGGQTYLRLPDWWANLTFLAFLAVVAVAIADEDLLVACAVAIVGMVIFGLVTVKEAVNFVEWNVYVTGSMAFGIGAAMTNSGLAEWCGQLLIDAGVTGFSMYLILAALTSLIANIVSNRGAIQVMFPIALSIIQRNGDDLLPYAVTIANAAMGGFITPYGLSPSLIVAGPGGYVPLDFIVFGGPLLVLYTVLSALMVSAVYGVW